MFVFVDDSGDPGLDFAKGASTHIVMSAVVFKSGEDIQEAMKAVAAARYFVNPEGEEIVYKREFKYYKTKQNMKDKFFSSISSVPFALRAIILDKRNIRSPYLLENPNNIKSYLIRQMMCRTLGTVQNAKLIIDGDDTRAFGGTDRQYFMRMINREAPDTIRDVEFVDSKKSSAIQIADMTAGAIRKGIEGDQNSQKHENTFRHRYARPHGSRWVFK